VSRFTPQLFAALGYGVYFFFASLMVLSVAFVFFLVPETRGVPLEAMDRLFAERPVWGARDRVMEALLRSREDDDNEWRRHVVDLDKEEEENNKGGMAVDESEGV
jgi:hypothetical protein